MTDTIRLGSGEVYLVEFSGEIPADAVLETAENRLGAISGGATLTYTAETVEAIDDRGFPAKEIITKESALFRFGLLTWNGKTLDRLCATASMTEAGTERTVRIGGRGRQNGKKYVLRFLHRDAVQGDVRITVVGSNRAGFSLAFAKGKETVLNPEFRAYPADEDGTLIIYRETFRDSDPDTVVTVLPLENGRLSTSNGGERDDDTKIRTRGYYAVTPGKGYTFTTTNDLWWCVLFYRDINGSRLLMSDWADGKAYKYISNETVTAPADAEYVRLFCEDSADTSNVLTISYKK